MQNIARMANDIAVFHMSFAEDEAKKMISEHINKFWAPSLRSQFFDLMETDSAQFHPLVIASAELVHCAKRNPICLKNIDRSGSGG